MREQFTPLAGDTERLQKSVRDSDVRGKKRRESTCEQTCAPGGGGRCPRLSEGEMRGQKGANTALPAFIW